MPGFLRDCLTVLVLVDIFCFLVCCFQNTFSNGLLTCVFSCLNLLRLFKKRFYLFFHERHTDRERGRGRSRLHTGSPTWDSIRDSRITPWAEGGAKLLSRPGCPQVTVLNYLCLKINLYTSNHIGLLF